MSIKPLSAALAIMAAITIAPKPALALAPNPTVIDAPGLPATCATTTYQDHGTLAFPAFCENVERALLSNGPFKAALQHARRVNAVISFAALPNGRIFATLLDRSTGNVLIDRSLLSSLQGVRAPATGSHPLIFAMPIVLRAVDNSPAVTFHVIVK
ncbi:MAG: hypothetical protein ACP5M1_09950 [Acidiphilium sp.]